MPVIKIFWHNHLFLNQDILLLIESKNVHITQKINSSVQSLRLAFFRSFKSQFVAPCSITRDSQGKHVQFARQHAKVWDFTSRHACLEVKFGFSQVQVCFIGGSLPVILSSMHKITSKLLLMYSFL